VSDDLTSHGGVAPDANDVGPRVAIVTGAASGIGRACADRLVAAGLRVVVADLHRDRAEDAAADLRAAGGEAVAVSADVTEPEANEAMVKSALEHFGRLDALICNAGLATKPLPITQTTVEEFERVLRVNVLSVFLGVRAALPALAASDGAAVAITASVMGIRTRPGFSAYASSKAAVIHLAQTLALELAPQGIRVNCVAPVATDTPMLSTFIGDQEEEAGRAQFIAGIPLGRLATPEDVADALTFLVSPQSRFITGTVLPVDGGRAL